MDVVLTAHTGVTGLQHAAGSNNNNNAAWSVIYNILCDSCMYGTTHDNNYNHI